MSRTYHRRGQRLSKEGRRALARFHSDACWTLKSTAPRWGTRAARSLSSQYADGFLVALDRPCGSEDDDHHMTIKPGSEKEGTRQRILRAAARRSRQAG